mmetsp:Transcript_4794/g.19551  ORF Transcript_4794/g.19551 Transcript_4794/m.19551 type:complete len:277 (+) Transcript_4794:3778-4608(+)
MMMTTMMTTITRSPAGGARDRRRGDRRRGDRRARATTTATCPRCRPPSRSGRRRRTLTTRRGARHGSGRRRTTTTTTQTPTLCCTRAHRSQREGKRESVAAAAAATITGGRRRRRHEACCGVKRRIYMTAHPSLVPSLSPRVNWMTWFSESTHFAASYSSRAMSVYELGPTTTKNWVGSRSFTMTCEMLCTLTALSRFSLMSVLYTASMKSGRSSSGGSTSIHLNAHLTSPSLLLDLRLRYPPMSLRPLILVKTGGWGGGHCGTPPTRSKAGSSGM